MKIPFSKLDRSICLLFVAFIVLLGMACYQQITRSAHASSSDRIFSSTEEHFVTIHDSGEQLTLKTTARTVSEVIKRARLRVDSHDIIEPAPDVAINADNFHINIYRSHPVVVEDGATRKYLLTASHDPASIAKSAGLTLYDGDNIRQVSSNNFLEAGVTTTYRIKRQGGRTITVESNLPFTEESVDDPALDIGQTKLLSLGEEGRKITKYKVNFVNNKEVSRELISETIAKVPVPRRVAKGAKRPIPPEWNTCAGYARAAGVSEADLYVALQLIYRESGCRFWAENTSSGAYGIPQALPGSKMASAGADWKTNPVTQIRWMIGYVNGRYGGWSGAWNWWQAKHWY